MRPLTNISFSDRIRPSAAVSVCQKMVGAADGGEKKKKSAHRKENTAVLSRLWVLLVCNRQPSGGRKIRFLNNTTFFNFCFQKMCGCYGEMHENRKYKVIK